MITITLCNKFYSQKAIKDSIYWFSEELAITVKAESTEFIIDCITDDAGFKERFIQKLNDYNLRETIAQRTSGLKDLIIAKAFYPESLEIEPVGDFDDPVMMEKRDEAE